MPQNPPSYTTIEVAKRLGVSLQTVQRWVDAGHLKAWKTLGGHRRIEAAGAELLFKEKEDSIGESAGPPPEVEPRRSTVSVVVVDDNPLDRALLTTLVQKALPGANVEAAANGFQGLVVIGKTTPDIVITDIHMPHMDGAEMIRHLLQDETNRPRTVIVVSAMSAQEIAERERLPPGVLAISKPLDQEAFVAMLRAAR